MKEPVQVSIYNNHEKVYSNKFLIDPNVGDNFEKYDSSIHSIFSKKFPNCNINFEWGNGNFIAGTCFNQDLDREKLSWEEYMKKWFYNESCPIEENFKQKIREIESEYVMIIET